MGLFGEQTNLKHNESCCKKNEQMTDSLTFQKLTHFHNIYEIWLVSGYKCIAVPCDNFVVVLLLHSIWSMEHELFFIR